MPARNGDQNDSVHSLMRRVAALLLVLLPVLAASQNPVIEGKQISEPPTIDGFVNADEWSEAAMVEGLTLLADGSREPFHTRAWIGYDQTNIYIAFVCDDPNPSLIRATEYRRGGNLSGDDVVWFVINAYATKRSEDFSQFEVSAGGGSRFSIAGGRAAKREWQGDWITRSRLTDSGYEVEIAIPWAILPLPGSGIRDIDINLGRVYRRQQLTAAYANIGPDERSDRHAIWKQVSIPQIDRASVIQALPYQVVGYSEPQDEIVFNSGVDLRYRINPQVTALGSVNPDFQNIESAVLGLEFSRFERLADERRPFFVEGGDFFRLGGSARPFASQRIGQFDLGGKVFGNVSDSISIGALTTVQIGHATNSAIRYRQALDPRSSLTLGWVYSDREDTGISNNALNAELMLRGERWGIGLIHATTHDSQLGFGNRFDADIFYGDKEFQGSFGWQQISPEYLPRIGFAPRRGLKGWQGRLQYEKLFTTGSVSQVGVAASFFDSDKWDGSGVYFDTRSFSADVSLRNGLKMNLRHSVSNFQGSSDRLYGGLVTYPSNNPYTSISVGTVFGTVDGNDYIRGSIYGYHKFPFKLTVSGQLSFENNGSQRSQLHIAGINYELTEYQSIAGRIVIRDSKANWYLSFRQSGNFGAEYYLIVGDPNADSFQKRIILKAVVPFEIRI